MVEYSFLAASLSLQLASRRHRFDRSTLPSFAILHVYQASAKSPQCLHTIPAEQVQSGAGLDLRHPGNDPTKFLAEMNGNSLGARIIGLCREAGGIIIG
jgi:hypothetical protein